MKWPRFSSGLLLKAFHLSRVLAILLLLLAISSLPVFAATGTTVEATSPERVKQAKDTTALAAPLPAATEVKKLEVTSADNSVNIKILTNGQVLSYRVVPQGKNFLLELPTLSLEDNVANIPVDSQIVKSIQVDASAKGAVKLKINNLKKAYYSISSTPEGLDMIIVPSEETTGKKGTAATTSRIKGIGFQMLSDGKSDIHMEISGLPPVEVRKTGEKELCFILDKTFLPEKFRRYLDTSQFISAVDKIIPEKDPKSNEKALIKVALRENVPYWVETKEGAVEVKFAPSHVPPEKPIKLTKPVTLEQGTKEKVAQKGKLETSSGELNTAAVSSPSETLPPLPEDAGLLPESSLAPVEESGADLLGIKKEYTGEPISLDLQDANLVNVLRLIADISGTNMIIEPGIKGKVTLKVEKVPWDQVLDVILKMNGLGREQEGNIIRIAKLDKLRKEMEEIQKQIRAKQRVLETAQDLGEITQNYLQVNYAKASDIAKQIDEVKSDKGTISVDPRTNIIIYSDYPARVRRAREILARLDRPTPQVLIEARIVQATDTFARALGIDWSAQYDVEDGNPAFRWAINLPVAYTSSAALNIGKLLNTTFWTLDVMLSANESVGNVKIISAPRVLTLDGVEATISQGDEIPYLQMSQDGVATEFKEAVLELKVTPHITPDQKVRLEIQAKKDQPGQERQTPLGPAVGIQTRKVETELLIDSGDTVVIGGVLENSERVNQERTPGLSSIPILGYLFKNKTTSITKQELLIFISPKVIVQPYFTASGSPQ